MAPPTTTSNDAAARATVSEVFNHIIRQGDADYLGERVSQLQHSLQAATLAQQAHADDDTVLGALLHDVGRFLPAADKTALSTAAVSDGATAAAVGEKRVGLPHEALGERYLRGLGFSEKVCQLVGAHVMAKRYLTAVDGEYYDALSQTSKMTLKVQGGPFDEEQIAKAREDPWLENKLQVRRWDDLAKNPNMTTPDLQSFEDLAVRSLMRDRVVN